MVEKEVKVKLASEVEDSQVVALEERIKALKNQRLQAKLEADTRDLETVNKRIEEVKRELTELEANLRKLESAREQVEKTVSSYDGLNSTTTEYVSKLNIITTKIRELVDVVGKDYVQKVISNVEAKEK